MNIAEPVTALTDYVLAGLYFFFGFRLFRQGRETGLLSTRLAGAAMAATSSAAFFGGTHHALDHSLELLRAVTWKLTVYSMGAASFLMIFAAAVFALPGRTRRLVLAAALVKLAVYIVWVTYHDEFRWVIYDYAPAMAGLLVLSVWGGAARWIVAAVSVSVAGAAVQASGFTLHQHFNHNDLYHVIQMGAAWLFYRGFQQFRDRETVSSS